MADPQQLELLRRSVKDWNRWRENTGVIEPDLTAADLSSADLSSADLMDANLIGADLTRAILRRANLSGANLSGAILNSAILSEADLRGADFFEAQIRDAQVSRANLGRADLSAADLSSASLVEADLWEADLNGTNLSGAELKGATFSRASLFETLFCDVDLSKVEGLSDCDHQGPSSIDFRTLAQSGPLPEAFLRGCGLPDSLITYLPSLLNQAIEYYSCFISYSHEDKAFARRLHDTLQGRGIRCWLDEQQLLPGDDIYEHVDRGIRLSEKVLLCCSRNSLTSWWVDDEIGKAFAKEQVLKKEHQGKVFALIPLDLDGYLFDGWQNGKASQVRQRLAADFRDWQNSHQKCEEQIEKVIRALRKHAREGPPDSKL